MKCFGCEATGDALHLVAEVYRLDLRAGFREVLEAGCDLANIPRPDWSRDAEPIVRPLPVRPLPPPEPPEDGLLHAVWSVLVRRAPVVEHPEAMGYLRARGLDASEARGWCVLAEHVDVREALRDAIVAEVGEDGWRASGLACVEGPREGWWSGAWRGPRLLIPWRAPDRDVQTIQGRYLGTCPEGTAKYVFPSGRRPRWPFGCDALGTTPLDVPVAVVEGALDAVSWTVLARRHGVASVALGIPGVQGWRPSWPALLRRRPCILALDADASGEARAKALVAELAIVARRVGHRPDVTLRRPKGGLKDWNDALVAQLAEVARVAS